MRFCVFIRGLIFISVLLTLPVLAVIPTVFATTQTISRASTGLVAADPLTTVNTSYWTFFGDSVGQSPQLVLDHTASVSQNSGVNLPVLTVGTSSTNELIILAVALTCGASAACPSSPTIQSISSSPTLAWNLRNSKGNGAIGLVEYYAPASSAANWQITLTADVSCACVASGFSISGYDTQQPFDTNPGAMNSATGSSSTPSAAVTTSNANDMIIGMLAQGAATSGGNLKIASYGSGFTKLAAQKATGNKGSPQQFNVQGASEDALVTHLLSPSTVSITTAGSYPWIMLVDSIRGHPLLYSYSEDSQGLHLGVVSPKSGQFIGFFAESPNTNAQLFHAVLTLPYTTIPANSFNTGLYVQTSANHINYVTCAASVVTTGYGWAVVYTTGSSTSATTFTTVWWQAGGPLTRDCTIVTNGNNMLKVYLDGQLVYSNTTLNLQMPTPFNQYLEVENSYAGSMLFGTYTNYYTTSTGIVTLQGAPPGDTGEIVDSRGNILATSTVGGNGVALLSIEQYHLPITGNVELYDSSHTLVASTQSLASIWGGDVYSVTSSTYGGPVPPAAPTGLNGTAVSSSQVSLGWVAPGSDGGSPVTGYKLERSIDSGTTWSTLVSNTGTTSTAYSDTGLSASTTYMYRVSAINSIGTSPPSNTATVTTLPPTTSTLTVKSQQTGGTTITGMYTVLSQNGNTVATGFTPAQFTLSNGQTYTVTVANYGNNIFSNWLDTGSTSSTRTVTTSTSLILTAVYCNGPCPQAPPPSNQSVISVSTVNSAGSPLTGFYTTLWQNGVQLQSCFSPCSFTVNNGQTYQIAVADYGGEAFSHWSDGTTSRLITVNVPSSSTTIPLTAVYSP